MARQRPDWYRKLHTGKAYLIARQIMLEHYEYVCWICKHGGATDADYIQPGSENPDQDPGDPWNKLPAHGVKGCPVCKRKCNQERGNKPLTQRPKHTRVW